MLSLSDSYTALETLFGIDFKGNEGVPFMGDLVNEEAPATGVQVMYYGHLRLMGSVADETEDPQPTSGTAKLYLGTIAEGEKLLDETLAIGESKTIGLVLFTEFELANCRGYFSGYKYTKSN